MSRRSPSDRLAIPDEFASFARALEELEPPRSDVQRSISLMSVPAVIATREQILGLPLDSRTAFVLSLVDGRSTVETLLDIACMPVDEVMETLRRLATLHAIKL